MGTEECRPSMRAESAKGPTGVFAEGRGDEQNLAEGKKKLGQLPHYWCFGRSLRTESLKSKKIVSITRGINIAGTRNRPFVAIDGKGKDLHFQANKP